jgi:hypothetical protein
MGHDGTVNDFLVTHLDSIDELLLEYLDEDDESAVPEPFGVPSHCAPLH